MPINKNIDLFDKLISPILNYGSEVWGFVKGSSVERVYLQFLKRLLGVKRNTQNDLIYGEVGRTNYQTCRYYNIIKYWLKLLRTNDNKFIKKVYLFLKSDCERNVTAKNWCSLLKDLLCTLGFYDVWLFQDVGHEKIFLYNVKLRLNDHFMQNWNGRLQDSSRANLYNHIASFKFQSYLNVCKITKFRVSMSRLRLSAHRLCIETGRWTKPNSIPVNERKCLTCNVIEDEYHFVLECLMYKDLRNVYIPVYYRSRPNMQKFVELITNKNENVIKKLCVFVHKAFIIRSHHTYVENV